MHSIPKLIILTALQNERRAIQKAIPNWESRGIAMETIGIRACRMPDLTQYHPISAIFLAGLAGGLDPQLSIGQVVIDTDAERLRSFDQHRRGKIHTSSKLLATPADKRQLFEQTGALAVDMEQSAVRAVSLSLNVPFIGIRAISDTAADPLDPRLLRWIDDFGAPRPAIIARDLLLHPSLIPIARKLGRDSALALGELGKAVRQAVEAFQA